MHKKKRAQVTVYIILGVIVLFLSILLFNLKAATKEGIDLKNIAEAQKIPKEIRPITNYITTHLDDAAKKGLLFIGMQGGYIYKWQGGPIPDCNCSDSGKAISYGDYMVYYGIHKDKEDHYNYWFHEPENYPWIVYPYPNFAEVNPSKNFKGIGGYFGTNELPPLNGSSPDSIESQLMLYITNYLKENIDLKIFDEQGFEIKDSGMDVSVIIGENDITVFLEYPLIINKTITNKITKVRYFYTNPQIRLKKVYEFTDEIINKDTTNILFNISNPNNNKNGIWIEKEEDVYEHDDVIVIRDDKSMLYAEPYTFQFARENRYPALRYLPITKITFFGVQSVIGAKITEDRINPKADDPDEDNIKFAYDPPLKYTITQSDFDRGYVELTVYAEEEGNAESKDWQKLTIDPSAES